MSKNANATAHTSEMHVQVTDPPVGWANGYKGAYKSEAAPVLPVGGWTVWAWTFTVLAVLFGALTIAAHSLWPVVVVSWILGVFSAVAAQTNAQRWGGVALTLIIVPTLVGVGVAAAWIVSSL